jgi:hypothetical protein
MRPSLIVGILLLVLGAFLLVRGGSFTSRENILSVGELEVTAEERETIPPWVGAGVLVVGLVVIVSGLGKKE